MRSRAASIAACIAASLQGYTTAVGTGCSGRTRSTKAANLSCVWTAMLATSGRGSTIFTDGATTSAMPSATISPAWFVQRQSSSTMPLSPRFSRTVTVAVIVSSALTGLRKRSSWLT